jgi:hypothetical protein
MTKRLLSVQRIVNLSSDPATGNAGELYYNTAINAFKYYNGTSWSEIQGGGGGATVTVSETAPVSPEVGDLWYDSSVAKLFIYYDSTWVEAGGSGGGGGGIQAVSEDSSPELGGNLDASGFNVSNVDNLAFETTPEGAGGIATLVWDDGEGTLSLGLKGGNVNLQIGQENIALCYNGTGSTITKGSIVYISGAQGQRPSITLSDADTEATSSKTFGVVAENISNGAEGFVCTFGIVTGIDTSSFTAGQALWLSSTPGQLTNVKPIQPAHTVFVGYCLSVSAVSGRIFVNPQNGYEINELHDVSISSIADNHILSYDATTSLWKNQGLASAIQEVDGPSSGIDADLLDGQHASYFLDTSANSQTKSGDLVISGNLTVNGTTTTIDTVNLLVEDKNIELGVVASPTDITADGGGITLRGTTNKTFNWVDSTDAWTSSEHLNLVTGKAYYINGVNVLSSTALGSGVTSSSLTSVGTITSGTWQGNEISTTYTAAKVTSVNGSTGAITGLAITAGKLSQFATTTSSELAGVISDETGTGALVFANSPTLTGTPTAPTPPSTSDNNTIATTAFVNAAVGTREVVPLDDISADFDGRKLRFIPKYDNQVVEFTNPYELILMINGIIQKVGHPDVVWQSGIPREGFFLDWEGYIQFSEAPPAGSTFDARLFPVGNKDNSLYYPFSAVDIFLGA